MRRRLRPASVPRWIRRARVPVALVLGLGAGAAALLAAEPPDTETVPALQLTQPVSAGEALSEENIEVTEIDVAAVPSGHLSDDRKFLGRTVATSLPQGALIHTSQLVGPGLLEGFDADVVAVPVRPADASMISMISPGQHVAVTISSDAPESEERARRVADAAPVLWVPRGDSDAWLPGATGPGAGDAGAVVIIAVEAKTASEIAEAGHRSRLHVSLVSSPAEAGG